ncbi:START domain-containing protein [Adhaeribacter pallidiroseus]|uniref:START domain-containing protein n=1 Tax=Adhaeribacter pallidiroseus TaxID=2072847 RepID=A0A369QMA1_9BACT|nr:START domain-containing protein [Adhaeribacter pallidiroseus]RDC63959.1 hypothetical protein AHMF7616_02568 [Adhaeribacter pallidiroseus]
MPFLIFIFVYIIKIASTFPQNNWELRRNENEIAVYSRKVTNVSFKEIKVECELRGTPAQLVRIIKDVAHHPDWVYGVKKATVLKKKSDTNFIYHTESDMPWPVTDRDLVAENKIHSVAENGQVTIEVHSLKDYLPEKQGYVRVPYSEASWDILPLPNNKTKITYIFRVDPGGAIPAWLVNATIATGPYNSFMKLREILNKSNL